jgi:UDP-3-O-[3-hydroxymyristoyl] glucosamine N-acyltransferase
MSAQKHPAPRRLAEIAAAIGADLVGDGAFVVSSAQHPALAAGPDTLALAMDEGSAKLLPHTKARAAIVTDRALVDPARFAGGLVAPRDAMRLALAALLDLFPRPVHAGAGIHPTAWVDPAATLGSGVSLGPFVSVGPGARIGAGSVVLDHASIGAGAALGEDCLIHAGVRVGDRCRLGKRVIVQPNAVIGADGFSFVQRGVGSVESARRSGGTITDANTAHVRINSIGWVELGDDVEIGAGTCIDRGTLAATRVGRGTKIDNLCQIAHNCTIGEDCLIAGHTGLAGSVKLGNRVVLAGRVGVADNRTIGDDSIVVAGSGVGQDIPPKQIWGGYPAGPRERKAVEMLNVGRLPRIQRDLEAAKERLDRLERALGPGT